MNLIKRKLSWWAIALSLPFFTGIVLILILKQNQAPVLLGIPKVPALTLWLLPLSRVATDLFAVLAIGCFTFLGIIYPTKQKLFPSDLAQVITAGYLLIIGWLGAIVIQVIFSVSNVFAAPAIQIATPKILRSVLTQTALGKLFLAQLLILGIALLFAIRVCSQITARRTLFLLFGANFIPALGGHSGLSRNHELATSSMAVHVFGVNLWVGSLIALGIWIDKILEGKNIALKRFSQIALFSFFLVAVTGVLNSLLRIGSINSIAESQYGRLVIAKFLLTISIGYLAYVNRKNLIKNSSTLFPTKLVINEIFLLGITLGLAVILARTGFPAPKTNYLPSISEQLLGITVPTTFDIKSLLSSFSPDALWITLTIYLAVVYLSGVNKAKGVWPKRRTISFIGAIVLLTFATSGSLGIYAHVLFSAHMVQHMVLALVIPLLLVISNPLALAKQVKFHSEFSQPIDWYIDFYESPTWKLLTKPSSLICLTAFTYLGIYFTQVFDWLMSSHWGHVAMQIYLLVYGYALLWKVIGIDRQMNNISINQIYLLLITEPIHIFFGISLLLSDKVIGQSLYEIIDRPFLTDLSRDQKLGGVITLIIGELIILSILTWLVKTKQRESHKFSLTKNF